MTLGKKKKKKGGRLFPACPGVSGIGEGHHWVSAERPKKGPWFVLERPLLV